MNTEASVGNGKFPADFTELWKNCVLFHMFSLSSEWLNLIIFYDPVTSGTKIQGEI